MDQQEAANILRSALQDILPDGIPALQVVQGNVIRLTMGDQSYLVKWISSRDQTGQNELRVGRLFAKQAVSPVPRLMFEKVVDGGVIAGWEWADGHDLRQRERERLPEVFGWLGQLHRAMRNQAEVTSPLTSRRYSNLHEMLEAEARRLCALIDPPFCRRCSDVLMRLEVGFTTLIHGDMHPGNVLVSDDRVWFVDWSYACNSLNLFDLDYIHSVPLNGDGPIWVIIRPEEAEPVLSAYFEAAGLGHVDALKTHRAVMLWNQLRTLENCLENGYVTETARARRQIQALLAAE